jgi:hypothetical protein
MEQLELPCMDLSDLESRFSEEEVWSVIRALPLDKVPGSDGFTTRFVQVTWLVIRHDLMCAFDAFWHLDTRHLHNTNDAIRVLLPNSVDVLAIRDYRPITLIHIMGKFISMVLANRLTPKLGGAFVKGVSFRTTSSWSRPLPSRCMQGELLAFFSR